MTTYTEINETLTFVIAQRTPKLFETYRIERDAVVAKKTIPVYFFTREEAENHRSKFIKAFFGNAK